MATYLIELFRKTVSGPLVTHASGMLGESAESISSAIEDISASLIGSLIQKGRTEQGARDLVNFMRTGGFDDAILQDIPSLMQGGIQTERLTSDGFSVLGYLLDDKLSTVVDWVAGSSGLKTSSASTLLKIISPLMLGILSRVIKENSLNADGLKNYLISHTEFFNQSTPEHIRELIGDSRTPSLERSAHGSLDGPYTAPPDVEASALSKILPWIVLMIAALGLFYFLEKGSNAPPVEIDKVNQDSIKQMRLMDSIRNETRMYSIENMKKNDSILHMQRDTI